MELCIRKAKADQLGLTAVTEIAYASAGSERCLLTYFESYLKTVLGGVAIHSGCTKGEHKSYECPACGWVFPGVMWRGVRKQAVKECSLRKRFKAAFKRLEAAGVVESERKVRANVSGELQKRGLFRSVCVWTARCVEGEAWSMGADSEGKTGGYSRARV